MENRKDEAMTTELKSFLIFALWLGCSLLATSLLWTRADPHVWKITIVGLGIIYGIVVTSLIVAGVEAIASAGKRRKKNVNNLYLLRDTEHWAIKDAAWVIVAADDEDAIGICNRTEAFKKLFRGYITIQKIGTAEPDIERGIILTDFNEG
jgi:hypothetical protein